MSPLGWTFLWEGAIAPGARDGFIAFGLLDWDEFETPDDPECFGLFGGYFYNPLSIVRLMGARLPGASPEDIDRAYFDPSPDIPPYVAEPWHESEKHAAKLAENLGWVMSTDVLARGRRGEGAGRSPAGGAARPVHALGRGAAGQGSVAAPLPAADVRHLDLGFARCVGGSRRARRHHGRAGRSVADHPPPGGIEVDSAKPTFAMWELSRLVRGSDELTARASRPAIDRPSRAAGRVRLGRGRGLPRLPSHGFLHAFGSRGPNEWDLRARSWETNPELALAAIDRMCAADDSALAVHAATTRRSPIATGDRRGAAAAGGRRRGPGQLRGGDAVGVGVPAGA